MGNYLDFYLIALLSYSIRQFVTNLSFLSLINWSGAKYGLVL